MSSLVSSWVKLFLLYISVLQVFSLSPFSPGMSLVGRGILGGKADAEGVSWSEAPSHRSSTSEPEGSAGPSALSTAPHWGTSGSPCHCLHFWVPLSGHAVALKVCLYSSEFLVSPMKLQGWRGLAASFLYQLLSSLCAEHVVKLWSRSPDLGPAVVKRAKESLKKFSLPHFKTLGSFLVHSQLVHYLF